MNDMIEVKTSELIGPALDWAVLFAGYGDGPDWRLIDGGLFIVSLHDVRVGMDGIGQQEAIDPFQPSTRWQEGGPLIEQFGICILKYSEVACNPAKPWTASMRDDDNYVDDCESPLIAACRAIAIYKLGNTVRVPREIMPCAKES